MVSITYSSLHSLLNLSVGNISAIATENLIDQAIDLLNLCSKGTISNLSGIAGSKSATVTEKQRGSILEVAKAIYYHDYLSQLPSSMGDVSLAVSPTPEPLAVARAMAAKLCSKTFLRT